MHLRFLINSNNLNAQVNKLHNLKYWDYASGLPLVESIKLVSFSSSESKFGTSVNSIMLIGHHVVHSRTSDSHSGLHFLP